MIFSSQTKLSSKHRTSFFWGIDQPWKFLTRCMFILFCGFKLRCGSRFLIVAPVIASIFYLSPNLSHARSNCDAPQLVCGARGSLFKISSFMPSATAVRIGPDLMVANRLSVADESQVKITLDGGKTITGTVIPTSYDDDLILIRAALQEGPVMDRSDRPGPSLYQLGLDWPSKSNFTQSQRELLSRSVEGKEYSKIYIRTGKRPTIAGGVLVNNDGALVGIITSDVEGRAQAIGFQRIEDLRKVSGSAHTIRSREIGTAYRQCHHLIAQGRLNRQQQQPQAFLDDLRINCKNTKNQYLMDQAVQFFVQSGRFSWSEEYFNSGLERDPNSINTRLGLVELLLMARRYNDALPHIQNLVKIIPEEAKLQSYAIQTGRFLKDQKLVEDTMVLIRKHNPQLLEAAQQFLASDPKPSMRGSFN